MSFFAKIMKKLRFKNAKTEEERFKKDLNCVIYYQHAYMFEFEQRK